MRALLIVDVQNDFCEGGSLAVVGGGAVARAISAYLATPAAATTYSHVAATQDHHIDPGSHFSGQPDFTHSWPPHCVAGTAGADFHDDLDISRIEAVFRKGEYKAAYSGFEGVTSSGQSLADWLASRGVTDVDIAGVATDYCVRATALDALKAGLRTRILSGLVAGVSPRTSAAALREVREAGAEIVGQPEA